MSYSVEIRNRPRSPAADGNPTVGYAPSERPAHTADLVAADNHRLTLPAVPSNTDPTHIALADRQADGGRVPEQTSRSTS